jgi:hypothetical protein
MNKKNYYFTLGTSATEKEIAENKKLGFIFVNGAHGDSFHRECDRVAGNYPEHLADKLVKSKRAKRKPVEQEVAPQEVAGSE